MYATIIMTSEDMKPHIIIILIYAVTAISVLEWYSLWSNQIKSIFIIHQYTKHKKRNFSFDTWAQEGTLKITINIT